MQALPGQHLHWQGRPGGEDLPEVTAEGIGNGFAKGAGEAEAA